MKKDQAFTVAVAVVVCCCAFEKLRGFHAASIIIAFVWL
jgi:hypothetical protein